MTRVWPEGPGGVWRVVLEGPVSGCSFVALDLGSGPDRVTVDADSPYLVSVERLPDPPPDWAPVRVGDVVRAEDGTLYFCRLDPCYYTAPLVPLVPSSSLHAHYPPSVLGDLSACRLVERLVERSAP